jgi:hypothetical protein
VDLKYSARNVHLATVSITINAIDVHFHALHATPTKLLTTVLPVKPQCFLVLPYRTVLVFVTSFPIALISTRKIANYARIACRVTALIPQQTVVSFSAKKTAGLALLLQSVPNVKKGSALPPMVHACSVKFQAVHNAQVMDYHVKSALKDFILSLQNVSFVPDTVRNAPVVIYARNWPILKVESLS